MRLTVFLNFFEQNYGKINYYFNIRLSTKHSNYSLLFSKKNAFYLDRRPVHSKNGPFFRICRLTGFFLGIILTILYFSFHIEAEFLGGLSMVTTFFCLIGSTSKKVVTQKEKNSPE